MLVGVVEGDLAGTDRAHERGRRVGVAERALEPVNVLRGQLPCRASSTGPTQLENTRWAIAGVLNSRMARLGKSATSSAWNSQRPSNPEKRSLT